MRQEVPVRVHQLVDPLDPHRPVPACLDRERRGVVEEQPTVALRRDRAVPPHRRRRQPSGQNLLRELPHRDLVVVDRLSTRPRDRVRPRHHRRDQHAVSETSELDPDRACHPGSAQAQTERSHPEAVQTDRSPRSRHLPRPQTSAAKTAAWSPPCPPPLCSTDQATPALAQMKGVGRAHTPHPRPGPLGERVQGRGVGAYGDNDGEPGPLMPSASAFSRRGRATAPRRASRPPRPLSA